MAGKPSLKSELIDEILEVLCLNQNFMEAVDKIVDDLNEQESGDHANDQTRAGAVWHLLKALESYSAKAYEDVDRHVHATIQKLHTQELEDLKDDKPRDKVRIDLAVLKQKAFQNQADLKRLIEKLHKEKKVGA
ncbi:MAG: hypothetical protein HZB36_01095 [Candidatus Omnitrophica bacterium]|nr:hypothetical protein [Candidatus Omnitrophota bacterium]